MRVSILFRQNIFNFFKWEKNVEIKTILCIIKIGVLCTYGRKDRVF